MKLGVLFSGGKDSTLALHMAAEKEQVTCLITLRSKNPESYMFHTPNIDLATLQAQALNLPLVSQVTEGKKEAELDDFEYAISTAAKEFGVEGIVTGAVESVYQAERVQRICRRLNLWCLNPLWKKNQKRLLEELLERRFQVIISGIFAYPLDETWLGKQL
jgi:diphthine-ammonia ligase